MANELCVRLSKLNWNKKKKMLPLSHFQSHTTPTTDQVMTWMKKHIAGRTSEGQWALSGPPIGQHTAHNTLVPAVNLLFPGHSLLLFFPCSIVSGVIAAQAGLWVGSSAVKYLSAHPATAKSNVLYSQSAASSPRSRAAFSTSHTIELRNSQAEQATDDRGENGKGGSGIGRRETWSQAANKNKPRHTLYHMCLVFLSHILKIPTKHSCYLLWVTRRICFLLSR